MPASIQRLPTLTRPANGGALPENLIDRLLAEQKQLQTPVARFSEKHHQRAPDLEPHYRSLIPLTKPGAGEQYAFEVSLDRCTGCKACVSACHSLNGLDEHESWRDTGTLLGGDTATGWQQTITTACHHCADPGCLNGCPVGAYEKDANTGIVRHLDDQCIGCSYCILKCPYDVPKYSKKRGIVRKCDMCHQRLAEGEAPACVQACPTEAIRIITVPRPVETNASPILGDRSVTLPTTRYVGREVPELALAADREALTPQHAHWPLILMLTMTQAGIGLILAASGSQPLMFTAAAIFFTGMAASIFHLGQPLKAWRFFLGLKTSWLSREILAFSAFAPIPIVLCALLVFPLKMLDAVKSLTELSAWPLGLVAVFTSVMIYHDTKRRLWRFDRGAIRFFGTTATFAALGFAINDPAGPWNMILPAIVILKLIPELRLLQSADTEEWSPDGHTARLQIGPLGVVMRLRVTLALLGALVALMNPIYALPILLLAEILERQLFFQSVHAPKMPGNFGPRHHHH